MWTRSSNSRPTDLGFLMLLVLLMWLVCFSKCLLLGDGFPSSPKSTSLKCLARATSAIREPVSVVVRALFLTSFFASEVRYFKGSGLHVCGLLSATVLHLFVEGSLSLLGKNLPGHLFSFFAFSHRYSGKLSRPCFLTRQCSSPSQCSIISSFRLFVPYSIVV